MRRFFILWASVLLLLGGCALKKYTLNEAKIIIFKTPQFRFADTGYIRQNKDALRLELYSGGVPVKRFDINTLICVDEGCMGKSRFNAEYLSSDYPDDFLLHVSRGVPIFEGMNLSKIPEGFEQRLHVNNAEIFYRVTDKEIYFKDNKNRILIWIKNLP